jgi:leader peptidase (prepilin peptidase) / N-methyltransferase
MPDIHLFYIIVPVAFLTGISVGSFVTMASWRMPRGEEIVFRPSHCPHCGATLTARELVPLFSFIVQRGRCRHCSAPIGARYPLTELLLGVAFAIIVGIYGVSTETLMLLLLLTELAILIVTDLEHTMIPDSVQTGLFFTGIAWGVLHHVDQGVVLFGALSGLTLGFLLHYGYKAVRKKDGLGIADVKFFCVAGVWLPVASFVSFLFFAGIFGTITGILWKILKRGPIFPFGPALAVSLFINVLWPDLLQRLM